MNAFVNFLLNSEAFFTMLCCMVTLFIVGGPMRHQKFRYRLFVFCVATSLIGASLDKVIVVESRAVTQNARSIEDSLKGMVTAKSVILISRIGMAASGVHILVMWAIQCARINFWLLARARRRARRAVESAHRLQYQIH